MSAFKKAAVFASVVLIFLPALNSCVKNDKSAEVKNIFAEEDAVNFDNINYSYDELSINDIVKIPVELLVKNFNLTPQEININEINKYSEHPFRFLYDDSWNIQCFSNDDFMALEFNYNWYSVKSFIFKTDKTALDNGITVSGNYDEIKNMDILFRQRDIHQYSGYKHLFYGDIYDSDDYYEYDGPKRMIPKRSFNDTELYFDRNDNLMEIQINIVNIDYNENINDIIINEWKTYPTHNPQWILKFNKDQTFTFNYKMNEDNEYSENKGTWKLIYNTCIPEIVYIITDNKNLNINENIFMRKLNNSEYRIEFLGYYFFYPYENIFSYLN